MTGVAQIPEAALRPEAGTAFVNLPLPSSFR
jgi:hypothetical protein